MVGDAEDKKRWERWHRESERVRYCAQKAIDPRTPQYERAAWLRKSHEARARAFHLVA